MEEFLLRAKVTCWDSIKNVTYNKWVEGYLNLNALTDVGPQFVFAEPEINEPVYLNNWDLVCYSPKKYGAFIPETVGRWTGLVDKNSKKIFEGDIVKTKYGRLCIVVWFSTPTYCGWDLKPVNTMDNCNHTKAPDSYDLWKRKNLEVVGNVYDNQDILKGE